VLTARAAATLLAHASSVDSLAPITGALGFDPPSPPLDGTTRAALGVPDAASLVRVARGPGTLRALLLDLPAAPAANGHALRDAVARAAGRLAARSPHLLWLLAATEQQGPHTVLATWSPERHPPRIAALLVDRRHVVHSDAETLRSLAAAAPSRAADAPTAADILAHARWLDTLGRDSLTRAFYRTLERVVAALADSAPHRLAHADRRELALLHLSRLLFLAFLEAKGWLDGDHAFLANAFADATSRGLAFHRHVLLPLFFGTLNTPLHTRAATARAFGRIPFLNGGLFARTPLERRARDALFPDDTLGLVFGELLTRYRFTAREDTSAWSEAAIDPEMLGKAFESLMAATDRRASGAFYTPQPLVEAVTDAALRSALVTAAPTDVVDAALAGHAPADASTRDALRARIASLRALDPACGSGAFLVHALERIAALAATLGDPRPIADIRRATLTRSIFGVDVNPTAVWLCELRLWLSVVIESDEPDPRRVPALPNLDHHVRVGDSLTGGDFAHSPHAAAAGRRIAALRDRYTRASGPRKRTLGRLLDHAERSRALAVLDQRLAAASAERREILSALRTPDLFGARHAPDAHLRERLATLRARARRLRTRRQRLADGAALPFTFSAHFADAALAGGFDITLGNPPWVRLRHIPAGTRELLRRDFHVFRHAPWERGARAAHAGLGFSAQVDLAALFAERSLLLLRPGGTLALLLPAKLWRSLAGGGLRTLLTSAATPLAVEDWSESRHAFDAAVYPGLVVARRTTPTPPRALGGDDAARGAHTHGAVRVALRRHDDTRRWTVRHTRLPFDDTPGSPWLLLPPDVRRSFDRLTSAGTPLGDSPLARPRLGVKCGCNDAFVVRVAGDGTRPDLALVRAGGRVGEVERALLRPLLRGQSVAAWRTSVEDEHLVWTHDDTGRPLAALPPRATRWLAAWHRQLGRRADARRAPDASAPWWTIFRPDAAAHSATRVVWADLARSPRAAILAHGDPTVPLNSCYVARFDSPDDAHAFAALLNSPVAAAWLDALAEPARGGYRRYLAWTVALLPVPADWARARAILAPLARRALAGAPPGDDELLATALDAYALHADTLAPLCEWNAR
jgi:hypothetical protein